MEIHDVESLKRALCAGIGVEFIFFWGHTSKSAAIGKHVLSQWWPASFCIDGQTYVSAEHYLMAQKAQLFGDEETLRAIVSATSASQAKSLGRRVRGFNEKHWADHRVQIAMRGNTAKFRQNPDLKAWLLSTGDAVLVEASPDDIIWGIGFAANSHGARDPRMWPGLNLLGFSLMSVRQIIRSS